MGLTIAVIDDHESMRKAIVRSLLRGGLDVDQICEASNGAEALAKFSRFQIDLAIVDIQMPVMDGLTFIEHLRNSSDWNRIPCVLISGEDDKKKVALETGDSIGLISKPFSQGALAETIINMLSRLFEDETRANENKPYIQ